MTKRRWGDRYDGWKIRKADPFFFVVPHIMKVRNDAQVFFEVKIDTERIDLLLQQLRNRENKPVKFLHVVLAAFVRTISAKPVLNRFVRGRRVFARNSITMCVAVKQGMNELSDESIVKVRFDPWDTLYDVMDRFQQALDACLAENAGNSTDNIAGLLRHLPSWVIRLVIWTATKLDNFGILPKALHRLSPFHTSVFLTDLGSLGIDPVYHHIYDFGTTSVFGAFGIRHNEMQVKANGTPVVRKVMTFRLVLDERIADGFNMAAALHYLEDIFRHPEVLLSPPEAVAVDPGV